MSGATLNVVLPVARLIAIGASTNAPASLKREMLKLDPAFDPLSAVASPSDSDQRFAASVAVLPQMPMACPEADLRCIRYELPAGTMYRSPVSGLPVPATSGRYGPALPVDAP